MDSTAQHRGRGLQWAWGGVVMGAQMTSAPEHLQVRVFLRCLSFSQGPCELWGLSYGHVCGSGRRKVGFMYVTLCGRDGLTMTSATSQNYYDFMFSTGKLSPRKVRHSAQGCIGSQWRHKTGTQGCITPSPFPSELCPITAHTEALGQKRRTPFGCW